jgi:type VI secretion system protein ImpJ
VPIPPPGLPQISSTVYFKIDTKSSQWDDVQRMNNIAMFWDEAPEDLVAEVIVLRRS